MAFDLDVSKEYENIMKEGMHTLVDKINDCLLEGTHPILLAISRRMPHILYWYIRCFATSEEKEILDKTEIITEIALPFINFRNLLKKIRIIVVDDIVYSGNTINYIINLTKDFSECDIYGVFVFFCYKKNKAYPIDCKKESLYIASDVESEVSRKKICDFLSTIIAVTLPVDVTYPLLYLDSRSGNYSFDAFKGLFRDAKSKDVDNYEVKVEYKAPIDLGIYGEKLTGESNRSYTSILTSEISGSLNNDFAKIRCYDRLDSLIAVPYAPNILSDSEVLNPELFEHKFYSLIWKTALKSVDSSFFKLDELDLFGDEAIERRSNRSFRSLVAVANYLYSLSSFCRISKANLETAPLLFHLDLDDITLIVGETLAHKILPLLALIIDGKHVSPKSHSKVEVNSILIPQFYLGDYVFTQYMSIDEDDLESNLMRILKNARSRKEEFQSFKTLDMEFQVEGIMETFESLEKALIIKDYPLKVKLFQLVDRKIDESEIVSRYAYAYDHNGLRYWRRFFRLTSMGYF